MFDSRFMLGALSMLFVVACDPSLSREPETPASATTGVVVGVRSDGVIHWNGQQISLQELERRAKAAVGSPVELMFIVDEHPDPRRVRQIFDVLEPTGLLKKAYVIGGTAN